MKLVKYPMNDGKVSWRAKRGSSNSNKSSRRNSRDETIQVKVELPETAKIVVSADDFNRFEETALINTAKKHYAAVKTEIDSFISSAQKLQNPDCETDFLKFHTSDSESEIFSPNSGRRKSQSGNFSGSLDCVKSQVEDSESEIFFPNSDQRKLQSGNFSRSSNRRKSQSGNISRSSNRGKSQSEIFDCGKSQTEHSESEVFWLKSKGRKSQIEDSETETFSLSFEGQKSDGDESVSDIKRDSCEDKTCVEVGGEIPGDKAVSRFSCSSALNPIQANNRVILIKNLSGKSVKIIPKSAPVLLKRDFVKNGSNSGQNPGSVQPKFNHFKTVPKVVPVSLSEVQKYRPAAVNSEGKRAQNRAQQSEARKNSAQRQKSRQILPETDPLVEKAANKPCEPLKRMPRALSVVRSTKIGGVTLNPLAATHFTPGEIIQMPIYVDSQTQTTPALTSEGKKVLKSCGVQTDPPKTPIAELHEELPNIPELLEYLLGTQEYSVGMDEVKKSSLIDMSKNIAMKGKIMAESSEKNVVVQKSQKPEDALKMQLFTDLKYCVIFDFLGNLPVHNAVLENNLDLLRRHCFALKLRKVSVDIENSQGQTPLQIAVLNNCSLQIVNVLLANGSNVGVKDSEGNTTFHLAVMNSTDYNLQALLQQDGQLRSLYINSKNYEGLTPLMVAAIESKADMVEVLLKFGADPNIRDEKSGRTALFHAIEVNSNFVLNILLKYRADPKIRNFFGLTALDAAKDLDMPEASILEKDAAPATPAPSGTGKSKRPPTDAVPFCDPTKRSRLRFVSSYQKVEISQIQRMRKNRALWYRTCD